MPLTRLIRLTLVLSWIMFLLYVFFLDINRWEKFRYCSLLLALISWGFALFSSIKNSAAFDERSFHRTRPYGDRRAFWQHTRMIGWTLLLVFCAMLIRGFFYHLGWRATLIGASSLILLLLVLGTGLSAAYSLCLSGVHRQKLAFALLFYLPALCLALIMGQVIPSYMRIGNHTFYQWAYGVTNALVLAVLFPCLAWICAASLRRWKTSLALAVIAIFLQPFHLWRALHFYEWSATQDLTTASLNLRLRENIEESKNPYASSVSHFLRCDEPLQIGEFVVLRMSFPENTQLLRSLVGTRTSDYAFPKAPFTLIDTYGQWSLRSNQGSIFRRPGKTVLDDLFPGAVFYGYQHISLFLHCNFDSKHDDAFHSLLSDSEWQCAGARYLMKRVTSFRLDTGGGYQIDGGGILKINPCVGKHEALTAQVNVIRPIDPDRTRQIYPYLPFHTQLNDIHYVLSNADETKAVVMTVSNMDFEKGFSAESAECYPIAQANDLSDWTAEDIRDAKIHVLQTKTLELIEIDQSHLILEE